MTDPKRETNITTTLKRCSPETVSAALRFSSTHSEQDLDTIIRGVLERDLPDTHAHSLTTATNDSRLIEDLGMDSFGMIELVMTAEEVFDISIANQELRNVTTLGSLKNFVLEKVTATHSEEVATSAI